MKRASAPVEPKTYDRSYFERWYRDPRRAVIRRDVLERRASLALAAAEYVLDRKVRTVLDVGCGEGAWRGVLRRLRPRVRYQGVDPSPYVVRRFGRVRNLRAGSLQSLGRLGFRTPFDLVVCSDVLHYVRTPELGRGLRALARLTRGLAFLETFTAEDDTIGDAEDFQARRANAYRKLLAKAGLVPLGLHCYVRRSVARTLTALELPPRWNPSHKDGF